MMSLKVVHLESMLAVLVLVAEIFEAGEDISAAGEVFLEVPVDFLEVGEDISAAGEVILEATVDFLERGVIHSAQEMISEVGEVGEESSE